VTERQTEGQRTISCPFHYTSNN